MNISLQGKNALITGGTRGIGRAISCTLAEAGARIAAIYRSDEAAAVETVNRLTRVSPDVDHFTVRADISNEQEAMSAVDSVARRFSGALDILVLDAAAGASGPLCTMSTADWMRPFDVNVHGAFYMIRACGQHLQPGGSVVLISSGAGHDALEGLSAYGASKAAVNHLSTVLAQELGPRGIRVNVVSPGHTDKGETDPNLRPEDYTEAQRKTAESTALRRLGTARDVAGAVLFFTSDLSSFVTGQWLRVNGGRI